MKAASFSFGNRWHGGNVGCAPLSSCSFGVDILNRAFQLDPFRPHATAPCRGERRSVVFYHVGPEVLPDTPVRMLLQGLGFALADEPPPQEESPERPGTIMKPTEQVYAALGCGGVGPRNGIPTTIAQAAADFSQHRHGAEGPPDSARTSGTYRRVLSSLAQYRMPGTPGCTAEVLPQERGIPEICRKAYVRFMVLFHPIRGVAWSPVPLGQLFEASFGIRVPSDVSRRLRFRVGAGAGSSLHLDFWCTLPAVTGIVDCLV